MSETYLKSKFNVGETVWVPNVDDKVWSPKPVQINQIWIEGKLYKHEGGEYIQSLRVQYGFRQPMGGNYGEKNTFATQSECKDYINQKNLSDANSEFDNHVSELDRAVEKYRKSKTKLESVKDKIKKESE